MVRKKTFVKKRLVRKKNKKRTALRYMFFSFIILLVAALGYVGFIFTKTTLMLSDSYEDSGRNGSSLRDIDIDPKFDNISILFMGVDSSDKRKDSNELTDALMLATLNKDNNSVKLLSIPRDSYVYLPSEGFSTKINHAHSYAGTKGTIDAVENLLDVPVDYFVKVNFEAFIDIVDALDGIYVDVPYEFKEQDSKDRPNQIHLQPGNQLLNGEEALALARTRKLDNDIERGKRQQEIIKAMLDRATSLQSVLKYNGIINAVGDNMTYDLRFKEIRSLISYALASDLTIETLTLEGRDYQPGSTYYWQLDELALRDTKEELQRHLDIPIRAENDTKGEGRIETFYASPKEEQ